MSEMVERVTNAMIEANAGVDNTALGFNHLARAAIAAMREATPDMIEAAFLALSSPNHIWAVMIDAALKED